ncbi:hypothetical protein ABZ958_32615 [Streptomyces sp. NPDC046237]|uniref:hypothetical protein n=1 Tax=Streptomyces sp. NPDC046237 TaxID=3154914 RepID=UPI0033C79232
MVDNHVVMHARSEFEDCDGPAHKRHLLRLWLARHTDTGPPGGTTLGPRAMELRRGATPRDVIRPRSLRTTRPGIGCLDRRRHRADG